MRWVHQIGQAGLRTSAALDPERDRALTGAGDGSVHLWEASSGRLVWAFGGHQGDVDRLALSTDGRWLVSGSSRCGRDPVARVWDLESRALAHGLPGHAAGVSAVALHEGAGLVATVAGSPGVPRRHSGCLAASKGDVEVRLWDLSSGQRVGTLSAEAELVEVAFDASGSHLYGLTRQDDVVVWQVETSAVVARARGLASPGGSLRVADRGPLVTSGVGRGLVWNGPTGALRCAGPQHGVGLQLLEVAADQARVTSVDVGGQVKVWDLDTCEVRSAWDVRPPIHAATFSTDGHSVAILEEGAVQVSDAASGAPMMRVDLPADTAWTGPLVPYDTPRESPRFLAGTKLGWSRLGEAPPATFSVFAGQPPGFVPLDPIQWSRAAVFVIGGQTLQLVDAVAAAPLGTVSATASWSLSPDGQHVLARESSSAFGLFATADGRRLARLPVVSSNTEVSFDDSGRFAVEASGRWRMDVHARTTERRHGPEPATIALGWGLAAIRGNDDVAVWELASNRLVPLGPIEGAPHVGGARIVWRAPGGWRLWGSGTSKALDDVEDVLGFVDERRLVAIGPAGPRLLEDDVSAPLSTPIAVLGGGLMVTRDTEGIDRVRSSTHERPIEALASTLSYDHVDRVLPFEVAGRAFMAIEMGWSGHGFVLLLRIDDDALAQVLSVDGSLVVITPQGVSGSRAALDALVFADGPALVSGKAITSNGDPLVRLARFLNP